MLEFGRHEDEIFIPGAIFIRDEGFCDNCTEHHGYFIEFVFLIWYLRFYFNGPTRNNENNDDKLGFT